jgi:cell division ATPase FtsA
MAAIQKALKELSMLPDTTLALECFYADESDIKVDLSRALFEEVAQPHLKELVDLVRRALTDAGITETDVHSAELMGGGMRIPKVQQILSETFPDPEGVDAPALERETFGKGLSSRLRFGLDGTAAVATGATHYAAGRRALESRWNFASQRSGLAEEELSSCRELESWFASTNHEEVQRLGTQNALESYIYEARSWLSGPDRELLKPSVTEPLIEEASRWFDDAQYDEGTTLAMYEERLSSLKRKLEDHGSEYFEKKRREKDDKDKMLDEEAEKERQRRKDCGMDDDKDDRKMAKSERLKMAGKNKEEGNTVFKAGNLDDAAGRYQRALQHLKKFFMLDYSPDEKAQADAITLSVQLNLAQVYLKLASAQADNKDKAEGYYKKARESADEALAVDAENVKARFRKATALEKLGDIDGASKEVKAALKVDAENADLAKLKDRLDRLHAQQAAKSKKIYGKMFG